MGWSVENATNAYLHTLKTKNMVSSEPNVTEFISAMAAGNCSKLMVDVCANSAGATTIALIAAAQQTGGRVICVVPTLDDLRSSETILGEQTPYAELLVGDATVLLRSLDDDCGTPDFLLVDCESHGHGKVFAVAQAMMARSGHGGVVVGYNAMGEGEQGRRMAMGPVKAELLPIGGGLRVSRVAPSEIEKEKRIGRRSQWVVRVDECTGQEHVFRVTAPVHRRRPAQA